MIVQMMYLTFINQSKSYKLYAMRKAAQQLSANPTIEKLNKIRTDFDLGFKELKNNKWSHNFILKIFCHFKSN